MAERNTPNKFGELIAFQIAAATLIEAGNLVATNAAGYLVPAADAAGLTVVGVADETVNNTGAAGALSVLVRRKNAFRFENEGTALVGQANIGKNIYTQNSTTVRGTAGTNSIVSGKCLGVDADGVWVEVQ